jgi:hypothetical protein
MADYLSAEAITAVIQAANVGQLLKVSWRYDEAATPDPTLRGIGFVWRGRVVGKQQNTLQVFYWPQLGLPGTDGIKVEFPRVGVLYSAVEPYEAAAVTSEDIHQAQVALVRAQQQAPAPAAAPSSQILVGSTSTTVNDLLVAALKNSGTTLEGVTTVIHPRFYQQYLALGVDAFFDAIMNQHGRPSNATDHANAEAIRAAVQVYQHAPRTIVQNDDVHEFIARLIFNYQSARAQRRGAPEDKVKKVENQLFEASKVDPLGALVPFSSGRSSSSTGGKQGAAGKKCHFCGKPGHFKEDCFRNPASPKYKGEGGKSDGQQGNYRGGAVQKFSA